jgi:hypothetical protein
MPLYRNIGGVQKSTKAYRNISGTWKACSVWRNIAGVWKQITSLMTASATPTNVGFVKVGGGTSVLTSDATTATPTGGTGPFTYVWSQVGGDSMTINTPNAASTTFSKSVPDAAGFTGYFVCTITDSLGAVAATNTVQCDLAND